MKRKNSLEELEQKPHYAAILALIREYAEYKGGIKQAHLRYALIENPDFSKKTEREMEGFFKDTNLLDAYKILPLFNKPILRKGCIKTRQGLNNFLDRLIKMGLIEKHGKGLKTRYFLSKKYQKECDINDAVFSMRRWNPDKITKIEDGFPFDSQISLDSYVLFGMPDNKELTGQEKKIVEQCINNIIQNMRKILKIKNRNNKKQLTSEKYMELVRQSITNGEHYLGDYDQSSSFCFYYKGQVTPLTEEYLIQRTRQLMR